MRRIDFIYLFSLAAYTFLFWEQEPGLNVLIMNIVLIGGLVLHDRTVLCNRQWCVAALGALISAASVAWYGHALGVIANLLSLTAVSAFVLHRNNSIIIAGFMSVISGFSAAGFIVISLINRLNSMNSVRAGKWNIKRVLLVVAVLAVALVFFAMYRGSSVLFLSFTNKIDLSFISIGWCVFVCIGAVLTFGFYRQHRFAAIADWDAGHSMSLYPTERQSLLDKVMTIDSEYFSGVVLFGILNAMLLLLNGLDIAFLTSGSAFLPDDVTYSEYVHQGIGMLILSIICSTLLILYFFRNHHTESRNYRQLKWLAVLWILQNIFMVAVTIYRNHSYIFVFGLTYKRIGVDVYLLLALIGLVLVAWKVLKQKSLAFVTRRFGWAVFSTLIIATPVNWDRMIFNYNSGLMRNLDMDYLNELSSGILPEQINYIEEGGHGLDSLTIVETHRKLFRFFNTEYEFRERADWQSYTIQGLRLYDHFNFSSDVNTNVPVMHASTCYVSTLRYFPYYAKVTEINLSYNELDSLGDIAQYRNLRKLDLRGNWQLASIKELTQCPNLQELIIDSPSPEFIETIAHIPSLRELHVPYLTEEEIVYLHSYNEKLIITQGDYGSYSR